MRGPDRRSKWREAVYAPRDGMTHGCRVLLLRLSDDMDRHGVVSIPRNKLAEELGCHPSRITEWVTLAKELGFLDTVRRGRPHVTAVYQATIPSSRGAQSAPLEVRNPHLKDGDLEVRKPGGVMVRIPHLYEGSRGAESGQPSSSTQAEHSSVRPAVVQSTTGQQREARRENAVTDDSHKLVTGVSVCSLCSGPLVSPLDVAEGICAKCDGLVAHRQRHEGELA